MFSLSPYGLIGAAVIFSTLLFAGKRSKSGFDAIPTDSYSTPILSYITSLYTYFSPRSKLKAAHEKYGNRFFRVAFPGFWLVTTSDPKFIEEIRKSDDNDLSFEDAADDVVQVYNFTGDSLHEGNFHARVIRQQLTKNLGAIFPVMRDEISEAFAERIPLHSDEWLAVPAFDLATGVIAHITNRVFVGLPYCRNSEYLAAMMRASKNIGLGSMLALTVPSWLRLLLRPFFDSSKDLKLCLEIIGPHIEERLKLVDHYDGDYPNKPNDMLSWLIDDATGDEKSVRDLTLRILVLNFASIHTTSMTFTQSFFYLAAFPELVAPLREEVENIVRQDGWSKQSIDKMHKLDSLFKESMYFTGVSPLGIIRKARRNFTFSDGTTVVPGTIVAALRPEMLDPDVRPTFAEILEPKKETTGRRDMVSTGGGHINFGHGRHACPGRFFASTEMKTMMAHILLTYDVKMEREGEVPKPMWIGQGRVPNATAKVLFRRRVV